MKGRLSRLSLKSRRILPSVSFLVSFIVLIGAWEAAVFFDFVNPLILPPPSAIVSATGFVVANFFSAVGYWEDTWITFYEVVLGYIVGCGSAMVLGTLSAEFRPIRQVVIPYTVALNATPKIALAPLFIVWFGFGAAPKVLIAALICFFPVMINTITGLTTVDEDDIELMKALRANRWQTFRYLKVYNALPYVFASLRTAMAFAVVGAIVGEFAGAQRGLGFQIEFAAARLDTARLFAFLVILSVLAFALYGLVDSVERRLVFWSGDRVRDV